MGGGSLYFADIRRGIRTHSELEALRESEGNRISTPRETRFALESTGEAQEEKGESVLAVSCTFSFLPNLYR